MVLRTDLEIGLKTKGFQQGQQRVTRVAKELEQSLQKATTKQISLTKAMEGMADKGTKAYKDLAKELKAIDREAGAVEKTLGRLDRAFKRQAAERKREAAQGGFAQGMFQGMAPGVSGFIQRGPGMRQQIAGQMIGGGIRGAAGAAGQMPFGGAGAVAQGLAGIPVVGGAAAAGLQTVMQQAGQALHYRQQQQQAMPFIGGGMQMAQRMRGLHVMSTAEIKRSAAAARATAEGRGIDPSLLPGVTAEARQRMGAGGGLLGTAGVGIMSQYEASAAAQDPEGAIRRRRGGMAAATTAGGLQAQRARQLRRRGAARTRPFRGIAEMGLEFGYAAPEATQMAAQISQAGGGVGREMRQQGVLQTGMAAQRLFGIGGDVSGAFLQAGRRGGAVGARGRGGEAMVDAIGEGMKLGLEGSELTEFMSQMANDIRSWKQTGIPLNSKTIGDISGAMGGLGLGGIRGGVVGRGITQAARGLSQRGPGSAAEFVMMQELGGFGGGGAEAFETAQERLEQGEFTGEDIKRVLGRFMGAGGGGAGGRGVFRRAMRGMGIQVGVRETKLMEKQLRGERLTASEASIVQDFEDQQRRGEALAPKTSGEMASKAAAVVDPAIRRQASIQNQQIANGQKMIGVMQNFEQTTMSMSQAFADLTAGALTDMTKGMSEIAELAPALVKKAKEFIGGDGDITGAVSGGGG